MKINSFLKFSIFLAYVGIVYSKPNEEENSKIGCQQRSTSGRDYVGEANTTIDGLPCQRWSETHPHDHDFTHVGDHNFCRNPDGGNSQSQVWCYTTDPEVESQYCLVRFCPPLKALDFSLDNDHKPDENNSYTHAFLQKENLPPSFTICTAFMVEAWTKYVSAMLFVLHDDNRGVWHWVRTLAHDTYTEFSFQFEDFPPNSNQSKILLYPLQWIRVCLSKDSNTSLARLVVDGELLIEQEVKVKNQPDNLNLVLGSRTSSSSGNTYEDTGQTTDLNIFSSALTVEQMKSLISAGRAFPQLGDVFREGAVDSSLKSKV